MASNDNGRVGGRIRRYARVTTTMTGLAARMAGERYLGLEIDRSKHAADLRDALGGLKGPIMKVAQILSTIPDALPPEYADELASLQADAPAMRAASPVIVVVTRAYLRMRPPTRPLSFDAIRKDLPARRSCPRSCRAPSTRKPGP